MDEAMIYRWNSVVGYEDLVIHLGDFGLGNEGYIRSIRNRLNGNIVMVFGNHSSIERKLNWYKTFDYLELKVAKYPSLALSHYAHRIWNKMHKGTWHLYGHSHGTLPEDPHFKSFDVGVDSHNFTPWSMEEIAKKMATKQ
jgi:calcineurin-like phosphoesterase family protein